MKKIWNNILAVLPTWLPLAAVATVLAFTIEVAVQQNYRMSANDPQIQVAEDLSQSLNSGMSVANLGQTTQTDISKTLSPFFIIYDKDGKVLAGSAVLDGQTPIVPKGVLDDAKKKGESRVTWEPKKGVRSAIVVVPFKGKEEGFVVIGRSLREVEIREDKLALFVLAGWLGSLLLSLAILTYLRIFGLLKTK